MEAVMGIVKVGTSGFSFPDWRGGIVYPDGLSQKEELGYYQKELGFNTLEVNATYYALLSDKTAYTMEQKTGKDFEFVVKGFRGFTHDPFDTRLADKKPSLSQAFENVEKFKFSLRPFSESGKLGAVLLQFPVFFYTSDISKQYILDCKKALKDIPLVIEFRNGDWDRKATFDFLRSNGLAYCTVDEPRLPRLMPFNNVVTSKISYLRLHGRNQNWFNSPSSVRYNYLYSDEELESFLPDIKKMAGESEKMYIFMNNCHAGSAVKNARRLKEMLVAKQEGLF
jgi:uncharacterized protein YecE (DUF72 family)